MFVEEWVASREKHGTTYEIFVNPESGELLDLEKSRGEKEIRYIVDFENEKIYVFPIDMLHSTAASIIDYEKGTSLKRAYRQRNYKDHDFADGDIEGSKILIYQSTYKDYSKDKRFEKIKRFFEPGLP